MRKTICSRLSVLGVAVFAVAQAGSFTLRPGAVGPITIGMSAKSVQALFPRNRCRLIDLQLEGEPSPALAITLPGSRVRDGVIAELLGSPNQYTVYRINITDPQVKTERGIGVGSTVAELRANYRVSDRVMVREGCECLRVPTLGTTFDLDPGVPLFNIRRSAAVPGTIKIVRMLVTAIYPSR